MESRSSSEEEAGSPFVLMLVVVGSSWVIFFYFAVAAVYVCVLGRCEGVGGRREGMMCCFVVATAAGEFCECW